MIHRPDPRCPLVGDEFIYHGTNGSHRYTVIEVSGLDRPGLLYDLTSAMSRLNLNIGSAHIATFGEKAVDVFYVTDLAGGKVASPSRHATIRKTLLEVFGQTWPSPAPRNAT